MKRHRKDCDAWKGRDVAAVRLQRQVATYQRHHGEGVTNPVHVEAVRIRRAATVKERYGAENPFSRDSSLFDMVQSHWDGKDRTAHLPRDNFSRPEVKEKIRKHWQDNHGVDNPSQVPEIREKQLRTNLERYGDEQTLRVPEVREKIRQTLLARYGVEDAAQSPEIRVRIQATNMDRYGVPWTTIHPETRIKMANSFLTFLDSGGREVFRRSYNLEDYQRTCLKKYGVNHPMKNREYAAAHLARSRRAGPNSLERRLQELFPQLMFTGDGSYWRFLPLLDQNKNPDFILPGPHVDSPFRDASAVVEVFGDYWHGEAKTGKSCVEHEMETVAAWNDAGMRCLILWEAEFSDEARLIARTSAFLGLTAS